LLTQSVSAQFAVTINIFSPAPTYLSDWSKSSTGMMTVTYNNPKDPTSLVKFRTTLQYFNGGVIATSNNATAPVYTIQQGPNLFTLDKALQLDNLQFSNGAIVRSIQTSGRLPVASYQLCVQLLNATTNVELLKVPFCMKFDQVNYQLPYLLSPNDKTWLDANIAQSVITFRWSSVVPKPREPVFFYRLQVFEVLENQQPMQALRSNQPILETTVRFTTQYIWRPQLSLKDSTGHVFIWTVQTLDYKGFPLPSADESTQGRSEPRVFGVCTKRGHGGEGPVEDCISVRKF
jgi:hypothetical protein